MAKILVALSGGVDSSVAAAILLKQGHSVLGATMQTGYGDACEAAGEVCRYLGIEHFVLDARELFKKKVIDEFITAYLRGQTPNPCVNCNKFVKFPAFWPLLNELKCDYFATGHYLQKITENGRYILVKARDNTKDQSYFLYCLGQDILEKCLFPLGDMTKSEVRRLAAEWNLPTASRSDSQDICFIEGDYRDFLATNLTTPLQGGEICNQQGKVIGHHRGLAYYTVGQRKGLGMALGYPAFVQKLDTQANRVIVGCAEDLFSIEAQLSDCNYLPFDELTEPLRVEVKIRYRFAPVGCVVYPTGKKSARLVFDKKQRAVTPGQSAVFYWGDKLIGGGIIVDAS